MLLNKMILISHIIIYFISDVDQELGAFGKMLTGADE